MRKLIVTLILAGLLALATTVPAFAVAHPNVPIDCNGLNDAVVETPLAATAACPHLFGGSIVVD